MLIRSVKQSKAQVFELLRTGSFKFPPPQAKMVFKCPTLCSDLLVKFPSCRLW